VEPGRRGKEETMVKRQADAAKGGAFRAARPRGATPPRPRRAASPPPRPEPPVRIGVISDTHGYMDPVVLEIFAGVTHIVHAGDIVDPEILEALEGVAPVTAVSGNIDAGELAERLPREVVGEIGGVRFVVGHKRRRLMKRLFAGKIVLDPPGQPDVVIFGHEHVPSAAWVDGMLLLNPGTASSPEEEDDGPTVAILDVAPTGLAVRFVPLKRRQGSET
jgi:putative phosphoesterase